MLENAFRGLVGTRCFAYIDEIVIFVETIQKHNENLEAVLERIKTLGLRLEPSKCEYLKPELEFLGFSGCGPRNAFRVLYWHIPLLYKQGLTEWTNQLR